MEDLSEDLSEAISRLAGRECGGLYTGIRLRQSGKQCASIADAAHSRTPLSLAYPRIGCYNAAMADWRQIQARIRKAKNSADALTKLSELYQRTHDAMVAWELGAVAEKAERNEDAVKWYTIAAERFRRADWKKKPRKLWRDWARRFPWRELNLVPNLYLPQQTPPKPNRTTTTTIAQATPRYHNRA